MTYSRGYRVEGRGAWSRWTCERDGCTTTATTRGDQHDDRAEWAAAAHQQQDHRDQVIREAAQALRDAGRILQSSDSLLTDADSHTHRGKACVTPEGAADALATWACQLLLHLPRPDDPDERVGWQIGRHVARRQVCAHDTRPGKPVLPEPSH